MNADVTRFRAAMLLMGYTEEQIQSDIEQVVAEVRSYRRHRLLDTLREACHEMTPDELEELEGGAK